MFLEKLWSSATARRKTGAIWPFERIGAFRLEPAIGSCFVQARVDDRWLDLIRVPGGIDQTLTILAERLNVHCRAIQHCNEAEPEADPPGTLSSGAAPQAFLGDGAAARSDRSPRLRTTARIIALLRPFRRSVILLLALSLVVVAIELAPPMLLGVLVDRVLKVDMPKSSQGQLVLYLLAIIAALFLIRVAAAIVTVWKGVVSSRVGTAMTSDLRNDLVEKLNELPLAFHGSQPGGHAMSRVADDTENLHTLVYHMTSGFLLQAMQLAGIACG